MSAVIIQPEDYKYFNHDANFDEERNRRIIAETIKETDEYFKSLRNPKRRDDDRDLRLDVMSSFAKHRLAEGKSTSFDRYIGKDLYKRLIGEKIANKVKSLAIADRLGRQNI